jgi:uncharacterized protein (DUF58 family)
MSAIAPAPPWTFDGVVRFTRVGTSFLVFTIVIGFAALNTGNNALYIGLTFMLGCLLLSGIASKGGLSHLSVELRGIDEAWAGRPADCILRISNRSRIWNVRDVVVTSAEIARPLLVPMIPKRGSVDVNASFLFRRRGIVQLNRVDLYTRYPFGFFLKKRRAKLAGEVVVFPRLLDSAARERFQPIVGEQMSVNRPGSGTEIHSFREYVRGDSLRHVAWKKSASLGRWIVKQTELESTHVVHAVLDTYRPPRATEEQFEELISAAATFVFHATRRGLTVVLTLPRMTFEAADAMASNAMFRALALVEPSYEPLFLTTDETTVLFSLRGDADARPVA